MRAAETTRDRLRICADLGYRAADLLQSNAIVWVEGPSDRLYIRHWTSAVAPDLVEGIHYSIMYYGGRLLSHLSAADPEVLDFISLRRINQYLAIVMDSDRSRARAPINATKRRVRDEFDVGPGFAWVTMGREIENYVAPTVMLAAHRTLHGDELTAVLPGRFDHAFRYQTKRGVREADKVKLARAVASLPADLTPLDLKKQVLRLVRFIRTANAQATTRPAVPVPGPSNP